MSMEVVLWFTVISTNLPIGIVQLSADTAYPLSCVQPNLLLT